jgi:hypothetical protein
MFGHVAGRQHRARWVILSILFALGVAWSYTVMGNETGDSWTLLRVGLAVGLGVSVLRLIVKSVSSKRHRRKEGQQESGQREGEGQLTEDRADRRPTYEEVFGVNLNIDEDTLAIANEDEEWEEETAEGAQMEAEGDAQMEAEAEPSAEEEFRVEEQVEEPATTAEAEADVQPEEDVEHVEAGVEPVAAPAVDSDTQDALQRMREEFKARAREAEERVKQREAELDEAASTPKSKS